MQTPSPREAQDGQQHAIRISPHRHAEKSGQECGRDHQQSKCRHQQRRHLESPLTFLPCLYRLSKLSYLGWHQFSEGGKFFGGAMRRLLFLNGSRRSRPRREAEASAGAGAELNVSAAAVSRWCILLEQRLGVALFDRAGQSKQAGDDIAAAPTRAADADLRCTASLTAQVTAPFQRPGAAIGVGRPLHEMADPAAADFRQHEPDIDVRITTAAGGPVRRRLELRHQARRRRMAGFWWLNH